jgi:hypothetical protein
MTQVGYSPERRSCRLLSSAVLVRNEDLVKQATQQCTNTGERQHGRDTAWALTIIVCCAVQACMLYLNPIMCAKYLLVHSLTEINVEALDHVVEYMEVRLVQGPIVRKGHSVVSSGVS